VDAAETSATVRAQVTAARDRQQLRQGKPNGRLAPREVDVHCALDATATVLLAQAMTRLSLSARAYHRILKVARTIADMARTDTIQAPQVAEAVGYRHFDRDP
jgi:magnesium chelatase family protein